MKEKNARKKFAFKYDLFAAKLQLEVKMPIKARLILSYIAMLVVPFILTIISAAVIAFIYSGGISSLYLKKASINDYSQKASIVLSEIEQVASRDPDELKDTQYLDDLDSRLGVFNAGIAVIKDDVLIYKSKLDFFDEPDFYKEYKAAAGKQLQSLEREASITYSTAENQYKSVEISDSLFIKQLDFKFSDGASGNVLVTTDMRPLGRFAISYFSTLVIVVLIILALTNGTLTYLVSRSILRPLNLLKHGTEQIKEGNLNFEVKCTSKDEIGELCGAFEEMRGKLKQSVELQMQYEDNRKELLSSISHDLKTPITAIKGYVEGIMDGIACSPEKMDKYMKTIYSKAVDMDQMIDDLFLFSKLDLKKVPFNFEKVNIKSYFIDCVEELRVDLEKKGIQLNFSSECSDNVFIAGDRDKLKRVVVNIIENSIKYMDKEHGKISISLIDEQSMVKVKIEDNGQGIKQEDLPNVFERFYRGDPSGNASKGGSGLGLAIAKQIIEGHEGQVWVRSEYGVGTSMFFTLKKL